MNKKHTHTESKLADRGWTDMQRILDREMPVERKRRPFLWFFWGAAVLLGTGITAWWLWAGSATVTPEAPKNISVVSEQPVARANEQTQATMNTPMPATSPAGTVSQSTSGKRTETASRKTSGNLQQPKPTVFNSISTVLSPNEFAASKNTLSAETINSQTTNNDTPAPADAISSANLVSPYPTLPLLPTRLPAFRTPHSPLPTPHPTLPTPHSALRTRNSAIAAYAAAHLNPSTGAISPSAGLLADWRWSRRFGLRLGVGYQYEHFKTNAQPGTLLSETAYLGITGDQRVLENNSNTPTGPVSGSSSARNVLVPVATIHRLEMPLQVFCQVHPRWRAYAGLHLQYAFGAQGTGSVIELDSSRVLNLTNPELTNRLAAEQTRGWTTYLGTGFSYQLNPHLELALQYRWTPDISLKNRMDFQNVDSALGNQFYAPAEQYDQPTTPIRQFQFQAIWKF